MWTFNATNGFSEAMVRGYKEGLCSAAWYGNATQCETIDDFKMQLLATDYAPMFQNEPSPIATSTITQKCTDKLVEDVKYLMANSEGELRKFLDYISYQYMIDNIILLITGTLHARDTNELLDKCHPLGKFEGMAALCVATSVAELYNMVLVDTPIAPYFRDCLSAQDLDELNIEIIRNTLYKSYLEDFYQFCQSIGGPTSTIMCEMLSFEADRRCLNITVNSFGTELSKDDRAKLFPSVGKLYPHGCKKLQATDDVEGVRAIIEQYPEYRKFFDSMVGDDTSMDDRFFNYEVSLNRLSFYTQFHYGVFYSYVKLKEQEARNLVWIAECISQSKKDKINNYIPIF